MKNQRGENNSEILIYSVLGVAIIGYFIPTYIPYLIFGGGLLGSLYKAADIVSKSSYEDMDYVSKENIKYFNDK